MTPERRILFVNRFYWPDEPATAQLLTDLAETLAAIGWTVTVLASQPKGQSVPEDDVHNGVRIVRVRTPHGRSPGLVTKARQVVSFARGALKQLRHLTQPGDILVVMTDPPLLGAFATQSAKRRGVTVIHWLQDIYPEVAMTVTRSSWLLRWVRPLRDFAWRKADACVVPGTDMASFVQSRGVNPERITVSGNWAPAGLSPQSRDKASSLRTSWGLDGKFVVAYSGNLGRVHDLAPIIHLAQSLRDAPEFTFLFIGTGAQRKSIEQLSADLGLPNVQFRPAQPREKLAESLSLGDVHLVTLRADCVRWVFPSKLYGITAIGRPVIFIGPIECEIARIVEEHRFGRAFRPDDLNALATALRALREDPVHAQTMARAAVRFHENHGRFTQAAARWNALLNKLMPLADGAEGQQATRRSP